MQIYPGEKQMKSCKTLLLVPTFVLAFMITATAASAPTLTFKFKTVRVQGALTTALGGINNAGVMVGVYIDKPGYQRGFMLNGKTLTRIDYPHGSQTVCWQINTKGAIVGGYTNAAGKGKGFLYVNGKFTTIPGPRGALYSQANGINDDGLIVGGYTTSSGYSQGFVLKGKTYTTLNVPGALGNGRRGDQ
jgi:uncharacterized membrane protein